MTNSKTESQNSESAVSKVISKGQKGTSSPKRKYLSLEGIEYSVEELRMLKWEKRVEILLFNLIEQGRGLEEMGKKILDT